MEWVLVYLTMISKVPVLGVGDDSYETQEACVDANAGVSDVTFWCVPRNWLDENERRSIPAWVAPS